MQMCERWTYNNCWRFNGCSSHAKKYSLRMKRWIVQLQTKIFWLQLRVHPPCENGEQTSSSAQVWARPVSFFWAVLGPIWRHSRRMRFNDTEGAPSLVGHREVSTTNNAWGGIGRSNEFGNISDSVLVRPCSHRMLLAYFCPTSGTLSLDSPSRIFGTPQNNENSIQNCWGLVV